MVSDTNDLFSLINYNKQAQIFIYVSAVALGTSFVMTVYFILVAREYHYIYILDVVGKIISQLSLVS